MSKATPAESLSAEAIERLVAGHRDFLAFLERRVESRAVAEDILQAAFTKGLEHGAGETPAPFPPFPDARQVNA